MATKSTPKPAALRGPFKRDVAKERMLEWKHNRPDLWQTISPAMRADVERYAQAKQAAADAQRKRDTYGR